MLNETQAKAIATALQGTHARPEKVDKATQHVIQDAAGKHITKVGSHITNGVKRFQVHVTTADGFFSPFTIGSADHDMVPLA